MVLYFIPLTFDYQFSAGQRPCMNRTTFIQARHFGGAAAKPLRKLQCRGNIIAGADSLGVPGERMVLSCSYVCAWVKPDPWNEEWTQSGREQSLTGRCCEPRDASSAHVKLSSSNKCTHFCRCRRAPLRHYVHARSGGSPCLLLGTEACQKGRLLDRSNGSRRRSGLMHVAPLNVESTV